MKVNTSSCKIAFLIEPDSNGGFVARTADQDVELHASTQEELQEKIREKICAMAGVSLDLNIPGGKTGESEMFHIGKKFTITKLSKVAGGAPDAGALPGVDMPRDATGLRRFVWIAAALLAGVFAYAVPAAMGLPNALTIAMLVVLMVAAIATWLARR